MKQLRYMSTAQTHYQLLESRDFFKKSLLLHPCFFSCWSVSCTGYHCSLPAVRVLVKTGHIISRVAGCDSGLSLNHNVGSWKANQHELAFVLLITSL